MRIYFSGMFTGFGICVLIVSLIATYVEIPITTTTNCTNSQNVLATQIQTLRQENEVQAKRLKKYEADAEYIKALGASEDTTQRIIKASSTLGVDPK